MFPRPASSISPVAFLAAALLAPASARAQGHPLDIHPAIVQGRLTTDHSVYSDAFDELGGFLFTENPGFETADGAFQPGDELGFALVDRLWYWNGFELADPPPETGVSISRGPLSVTATGQSGPQNGFTLATAGAAGFIHVHPSYTLDSAEPVPGVYGLVLELTSPQYEASDPLVIALGHFGATLTLEQYTAGVAAIGQAALEPPLAGDANRDRKVDLVDFGILKGHFGSGRFWSEGDFNADGKVDLADFGLLKQNFGRSGTAVPEPAAEGLMALGAAMVCLRAAWRRSRSARRLSRIPQS